MIALHLGHGAESSEASCVRFFERMVDKHAHLFRGPGGGRAAAGEDRPYPKREYRATTEAERARRNAEIIRLYGERLTNTAIAARLGTTCSTVGRVLEAANLRKRWAYHREDPA